MVRRLLSKSQVLYLVLEAKGLRVLPLATRRKIAKAIERDPSVDTMAISKESVILIQLSWVRKEVLAGLHSLAEAERMVDTDPELMHGAPVYRGTRIPVHAIADTLRANIADTLLVPLITEHGGKEIQHEEHEDILSGPGRRAQ